MVQVYVHQVEYFMYVFLVTVTGPVVFKLFRDPLLIEVVTLFLSTHILPVRQSPFKLHNLVFDIRASLRLFINSKAYIDFVQHIIISRRGFLKRLSISIIIDIMYIVRLFAEDFFLYLLVLKTEQVLIVQFTQVLITIVQSFIV